MRGHALGGSRKLNRHWQSGSGKTGLEENLVFFERELIEREWLSNESPYWEYTSDSTVHGISSHGLYSKKNPVRNKRGFKDLVILQPGDYQVHWKLETHNIQSFTKNNKHYEKIIEGNKDNRFGMFGINMYGMGQWLSLLPHEPYYLVHPTSNEEWYAGHAENYIAGDDTSTLNDSPWYTNNDIVKRVYPARTSTRSFLGGSSTFNMTSGQENPRVILHIGGSAPFPQYQYTMNSSSKEVWFKKYRNSFSPAILFFFTENLSPLGVVSWAITGKIWLERIGDYTPGERGWKAEILRAPEGYTILGDKGIIS